MKTLINNVAAESFEFAKRILYSFEVLIIGVLIPVLFIIGINTERLKDSSETEINISQPNQVAPVQGVVDFGKTLSDQNS
jgi:hypothetical protein